MHGLSFEKYNLWREKQTKEVSLALKCTSILSVSQITGYTFKNVFLIVAFKWRWKFLLAKRVAKIISDSSSLEKLFLRNRLKFIHQKFLK